MPPIKGGLRTYINTMPRYKGYNRRFHGNRKNITFRNTYKTARGVVHTAHKALTIAKGIKKLMNVEFKFLDTQLTFENITTPATIIQLINIPQGNSDSSRDGAQVKLTRVNVKYAIARSAIDTANFVRVMLVLDTQTNGAIYNLFDLLADNTLDDNLVSMLNLDNKYRFRILYNKVHVLSDKGANSKIYRELSKELNTKIRFTASTPSIADLSTNSLSMVFFIRTNHYWS